MKAARRRGGGVTLIEALVVLALLAILAAIVAPAMGQMVAQQRLNATAAELAGAIALARSEAIKQGRRMVLCRADLNNLDPNNQPQTCATDTNGGNSRQWAAGWLLFASLDQNAQIDPGEALLRTGSAAPPGVVVWGNTPVARYVSYLPQGHTLLVTGAFQAGTITVCRAGLNSPAVQIVISRNGRPRQQQATVNCV